MKVSGILLALVAATPLASAIPFKIKDILSPLARHPQPTSTPEEFPVIRPSFQPRGLNETIMHPRSLNETIVHPRGFSNETTVEKRAFVPYSQGPRSNFTFKA